LMSSKLCIAARATSRDSPPLSPNGSRKKPPSASSSCAYVLSLLSGAPRALRARSGI
jgi:hypothetical protein